MEHVAREVRRSGSGGFRKHAVQFLVIAAVVVFVAVWGYRELTAPLPGGSPTKPLAKLPTVKLLVGNQELVAEVARRLNELETGMMFRTQLGTNEAMLFVLPVAQRAEFYMRNTLIPLSCAYLDSQGVVQEIHEMKPRDETPIKSASANIRFVVEVNRGWFERHHVQPGSLVRAERGPLSELGAR